jgi:hypothetical protein
MRLIDADELLSKFLRYYTEKEKNGEFTFVACEIKQAFADMIVEAPTVEAEPVRHGKWIWMKDHWECSCCRGSRFHDLALGLDASFCGKCGAKMG